MSRNPARELLRRLAETELPPGHPLVVISQAERARQERESDRLLAIARRRRGGRPRSLSLERVIEMQSAFLSALEKDQKLRTRKAAEAYVIERFGLSRTMAWKRIIAPVFTARGF